MSEGAVGQVREDLLDDRMAAVLLLGLEYHKWGVAEYGVVAPEGNSSSWPWAAWRLRSLTRRTISRAVMACPSFEVNAVYSTSATSASLTQQRNWSSQMARGI